MICGRCDQPIRPGEKHIEPPIVQATGPGSTVVLHAWLCEKALFQTGPESIRH